jgi:hypothetical protein
MKSCIGVFKKVVGEYVYILMGFVDDILACAKPDELEHIKKACIKEFKWIMMDVGEKHSYFRNAKSQGRHEILHQEDSCRLQRTERICSARRQGSGQVVISS